MRKVNPYTKQITKVIKDIGLSVVMDSWNELYCFSQYEHERVWITLRPSAHEEKVRIEVQKFYSDRPDYEKIKHLDGMTLRK